MPDPIKEAAKKWCKDRFGEGWAGGYTGPYGCDCDHAKTFEAGMRAGLEMAAQHCCTSHAGDCCHETAEANAKAIRALAGEK